MAWLKGMCPEVTVYQFSSMGSAAFLTSPALVAWLMARAGDFDVVHVFGFLNPISSLAARVALWRKRGVVISPLGTISEYTFTHRRRILKRLWWTLIDSRNARRALVHVESAAEEREALRRESWMRSALRLVPPPFRVKRFDPRERRPDLVLFLSRLDPIKNLESLLEAWPIVLKHRPAARLLIAGDGQRSYVSSVRRLVADHSRSSSIELLGFVMDDRKSELLRTASLFVLPSLRENLGLAAIEAAASGLVCALSKEVAAGEFLESKGLALRFENNPQSIADAIVGALSDSALQRFCAEHGPSLVDESFSPQKVGKSLYELYEEARQPRR